MYFAYVQNAKQVKPGPATYPGPVQVMNQQKMRLITVNDFHKICRTCLKDEVNIRPISNVCVSLLKATDLLENCVNLKFDSNDQLPPNICDNCLKTLYQISMFQKNCVANERSMRELLKHSAMNKKVNSPAETSSGNNSRTSVPVSVAKDPPNGDSRMFKCDQCSYLFSTEINLTRHKLVKHSGRAKRQFVCEECGKRFIQERSLEIHKESHKNTESSESMKCEKCGETFTQSDRHINECSNTKLVNNGFQCDECGQLFLRWTSYRKHLERHKTNAESSEDKKAESFKCDCCPKTYSNQLQLKTHMNTVHAEKRFLCNYCGKACVTRSNLKTHIRTHTGEKPHKCSICNKSFALLSTLYGHMYTHTGYKPFKCKVCSKTFTQTSQLRYHKRIHSGEKPYSCQFCGKQFSIKSNCKVHVRIHTGETPYVCQMCGKGFSALAGMRKHQKLHEEKKRRSGKRKQKTKSEDLNDEHSDIVA